MEATHHPARQSYRLGLRQQLLLAFGFLVLLLLVALAGQLLSLASIADATRNVVEVEVRLSQLADDIAIQTLLCRRYEKDLLLNIDDPAARAGYLAEWQAAHADLGLAIDVYAQAAPDEGSRQQAERWQGAWSSYGNAVLQLDQRIASGELSSPQDANAALTLVKDAIRMLTDEAVAVADERTQAAEQAGERLEAMVARTIALGLALGVLALVVAIGWMLWFPGRLLRPVAALHGAVRRMAAGDLAARAGISRRDELGDLARGFDTMAAQIAARTEELARQHAQAEAARQAADAARRQADEQLATIREQRDVIREMSVPLLPLSDRALVMPLVGALDSARLQLVQEQALGGIEAHGARHLLLDITGVPVIDTQVAQHLMRLVSAARLLGAEVVLVGIRPEVAQSLVGLGVLLDGITTRSTLQSGVAHVLRRGEGVSPHQS